MRERIDDLTVSGLSGLLGIDAGRLGDRLFETNWPFPCQSCAAAKARSHRPEKPRLALRAQSHRIPSRTRK